MLTGKKPKELRSQQLIIDLSGSVGPQTAAPMLRRCPANTRGSPRLEEKRPWRPALGEKPEPHVMVPRFRDKSEGSELGAPEGIPQFGDFLGTCEVPTSEPLLQGGKEPC